MPGHHEHDHREGRPRMSETEETASENPNGFVGKCDVSTGPVPTGLAMEIVWSKVKGQEAIVLIEKLKAAYPRRDRHQRRAYNKLVLKAAKLGLLVRVATEPVLEGKPVAPEALTKPG